MLYAWLLFAQEKAAAADGKPAPEGPGLLTGLTPIFLIIIVFYFLIILPGRKEKQQRLSLLGALKKNDKVVTNSGIIGVVVNIRDNEVTIKSDESKFIVLKSTIAQIVNEPEKDSSTQIKPTT